MLIQTKRLFLGYNDLILTKNVTGFMQLLIIREKSRKFYNFLEILKKFNEMSKKDNSSKNNFHEKILRQNMHLGVINNLTQGFLVKRFFW